MFTVETLRAALNDSGDSLPVVANGHHILGAQLVEQPVRHLSLVLDSEPATFGEGEAPAVTGLGSTPGLAEPNPGELVEPEGLMDAPPADDDVPPADPGDETDSPR